jgi:hypothetical protein
MSPLNSSVRRVPTSKIDQDKFVQKDPDFIAVVEGLPDDRPSALSSQRIISKQRRIPAPIKIYSNYADFEEPQTAIYSPALPFSSTPKSGNARNKLATPQRGAPSPPSNRPHSILVISAPNSARRMPNPTEHDLNPPQKGYCSQTRNSKESKNVRFAVLESPAYSNLRSPAYFDSFRSSLSPLPYSPKTPDAMSFEDPDIVLDSPIEDAPMLSITPIVDTIQEGEEKEYRLLSSPSRGRQFDRETFLRLTGREPSPAAYEQDTTYLAPRTECQEPVFLIEKTVDDPEELRYFEPTPQSHDRDARDAAKNRSSAPASKSKGYLPKSVQTDRQSILSTYFNPAFRPVSY